MSKSQNKEDDSLQTRSVEMNAISIFQKGCLQRGQLPTYASFANLKIRLEYCGLLNSTPLLVKAILHSFSDYQKLLAHGWHIPFEKVALLDGACTLILSKTANDSRAKP